MEKPPQKIDTQLTHPPEVILGLENRPLVGPIYQSVKFEPKNASGVAQDLDALFFYSRIGNPTVRQLELQLARLQGTEEGLCLGSGLAAVSSMLLSLLETGDSVLMFYESYKPSRTLVRNFMSKFGVKHRIVSVAEVETWQSELRSGRHKIVLFESPTNPLTRLLDIDRLIAAAREGGTLTVLDGTFAGFHNHHRKGIDLYIHSLTKFASGHGDVMGGALLGSRTLIRKIQSIAVDLGPVLDPHAAYLIMRGLRTYHLRFAKHCSNALKVAEYLETNPAVKSVYYPGLPSHPDHHLAKLYLKDFGAVVAFILQPGAGSVEDFLNRLKLFRYAVSLGSPESLAAGTSFFSGDLSPEELATAGLQGLGIRLSIGLEDADELIYDLASALSNQS